MCERGEEMKASSDEMDVLQYFPLTMWSSLLMSHDVKSMKMICQCVTSILI